MQRASLHRAQNLRNGLHEDVAMPDRQFPVRLFYYEQVEPGPVFPLHWHEQLELILVVEGTLLVNCNSAPHEAGPGQLIVINKNELHEGIQRSPTLSLYCLIVDLALFQGRPGDPCEAHYVSPIAQTLILFPNLAPGSRDIAAAIRQAYEEMQTRRPGWELAVKAGMYQIMAGLVRQGTSTMLTSAERDLRNRKLGRITTSLQHIHDHYADDLTIAALAGELGISKYYYCRLFKEFTGKTPVEYINHYRVQRAFRLLSETDRSVTQIASDVGFDDVNYFSRTFRQYTGLAPTRARGH